MAGRGTDIILGGNSYMARLKLRESSCQTSAPRKGTNRQFPSSVIRQLVCGVSAAAPANQ